MGFGVWGLGFGVWGLGFGVWGLGFGVWGLGLGVWGLGFGVWGLGFGVWGRKAVTESQLQKGYDTRILMILEKISQKNESANTTVQ